MSDSVIAKTYLNHYFKRNLSYAAYQSVNQLCQTNQGSFVLMQPGVEYEELRGYRFGFNGKEKDDDTYGDGNAYDFGARMYDSRLGRWMSVDPLYAQYADLSPFNFAGNCPILFLDIDGNKFINPYRDKDKVAALKQKVVNAQLIYDQFVKDHPNLSPSEIKDSQEAKDLQSAQSELKQNEEKAQLVDDFIMTLKLSNESEYNYFENLKDKNKNEIQLVINIVNEQGPKVENGYLNGDTEILPVLYTNDNKEQVYGVQDHTIQITIFLSTEVWSGRAIVHEYRTFANEIGDVKYYFEYVKDEQSYNLWQDSAGSGSKYYNSTIGAGYFSRQYDKMRVGDVKRTGKLPNENGNIK
jgi:RHS repeat-associated protein